MPVLPTALIPAAQARTYARIAAALLLVTMVAGGFGEFYVPATLIVASDAAATATNVVAHNSMFRLGFAAYLVEAMCDITLSLVREPEGEWAPLAREMLARLPKD